MRKIFIACFFLALAACANRHTVLVNSQGQEMTCDVSGAGLMGAVSTYKTEQDCIADAEKKGYRVLSETH
jgi:hypothetical protein